MLDVVSLCPRFEMQRELEAGSSGCPELALEGCAARLSLDGAEGRIRADKEGTEAGQGARLGAGLSVDLGVGPGVVPDVGPVVSLGVV